MGEELLQFEKVKEVVIERVRIFFLMFDNVVKVVVILIGIYEILFIFNFNYIFYDMFQKMGIKIGILQVIFQIKQGEVFVLVMILIIIYFFYLIRWQEKYFQKVQWYDYILVIFGVIFVLYFFVVYQRYVEFVEVYIIDVIFGIFVIIFVFEVMRRVFGWVFFVVVVVFFIYGIQNIGFDWICFIQQFYFDEGIFGILFFVMMIYVFVFVFFGVFLLKIGISDYIMEFMIIFFGLRFGGLVKVVVIFSGLMGIVSGLSVVNVLIMGIFIILLMKKVGYFLEIVGVVELVVLMGGQFMLFIMGVVVFIMVEFFGVFYNKFIIVVVILVFVYYVGVYFFIDFEIKRLGFKGMLRESFFGFDYFIRKFYIFLLIVVIIVVLVWGILLYILVILFFGVVIWVVWIFKDNIKGYEGFYVVVVLFVIVLMFIGKVMVILVVGILFLIFFGFVVVGFISDKVEFNEKFYIMVFFLFFIVLIKYIGMIKEQIFFFSGVFGIIFFFIIGWYLKSEDGRVMYRVIYEFMIDVGKMSMSVMLVVVSVGFIQGVFMMIGFVMSFGYCFVDLIVGNFWFLLMFMMVFSFIFGMGVLMMVNYIIIFLVVVFVIFNVVQGFYLYLDLVLGFVILIVLLVVYFFVFYFGIFVDVMLLVVLVSYVGLVLVGGDFWKMVMNVVKYVFVGYIGLYIYFMYFEMFIIIVKYWIMMIVFQVFYDFSVMLFVMYLFVIVLIGWFGKYLRKEIRGFVGIFGIILVIFNLVIVGISFVFVIVLRLFGEKLFF